MDKQLQTATSGEIQIGSFSELLLFADYIAKSSFLPKGFTGDHEKKKCDIIAAIQFGSEIGLSKMSSLQNIAVVNGVPTVWGDVQLGLCMGSGLLEDIKEEIVQKDGALYAICTVKRKGISTPCTSIFSEEDAKNANLWGKLGPWKTHPKRMLKYKARSFALRDLFPDVLKGLHSTEEMEGEVSINVTPVSESMDTIINIVSNETNYKSSEEKIFPLIEQIQNTQSMEELSLLWGKHKQFIGSLNDQEKEAVTLQKDAAKQRIFSSELVIDIETELNSSSVSDE